MLYYLQQTNLDFAHRFGKVGFCRAIGHDAVLQTLVLCVTHQVEIARRVVSFPAADWAAFLSQSVKSKRAVLPHMSYSTDTKLRKTMAGERDG